MTALVTRTIANPGAPLVSPAGALLPNTLITFTLVNTIGLPTNAVDAFTQHDVASVPITATTDAQGEFAVALWPTARSDRPVRYRVVVDHPGVVPFTAPLADGVTDLSWAAFMLGGAPLTPAEVSQLQLHLAEINAQKLAAEAAALAAAGSAGTAYTDAQGADTARALAEGEAADAMAARLAAEAAATQAALAAGAVLWVSGTTYALGFQVLSPVNLLTYRRKVAGAGVLDPSLDTANWESVLYAVTRSADSVRYRIAIDGATVQAGPLYSVDTQAAPVTVYMPSIAETEVGHVVDFYNRGGYWGSPHALIIERKEAGIYIQGAAAAFNINFPFPGISLICNYKTATEAWWNIY